MALMNGMMIDSRGLLWFTNNNWTMPALVKYDIGNNTTKVYTTLVNQDNTVYEYYNMPAIAEEQSEEGWRPVMGRFWVAEAGVGCRRLRT